MGIAPKKFSIIHWEDGEISTVDDAELPVLLPELKDYKPGDGGQSPLANATEWLQVTDKNGRKGIRETNTMPQWAGSCWYYLRYIDACNGDAFVAKELEKYWMPVDLYVGGAEHAVLHLLYSRFWHKVLFDLGLVSTDEPFQKLFNQGMILAFAYEDAAGYKDRSANASLSPIRLVKTSRFRLTQVPTDEVEEKNGTAAKGECRDGVLAHRHGRAEADGACATSSRREPTSSSSRLWRR